MGSNITAIETSPVLMTLAPPRAEPPAQTEVAAGAAEEAVHSEVIPATPPSEVLDAVAAAGRAYEKLERAGLHISLRLDERGRLEAGVQDRLGRPISRLSASDVLRAADGGGVG
jgi:hypothetical protein